MNRIRSWMLRNFQFNFRETQINRTVNSIPRSKSLPIIGNSLDLLKGGRGSRLHEYIDERHRKLGKIFIEKFGPTDLIFLSDAALIKTVFINLEGKYPMHILPEPWILYEKLYGKKRGLLFMDGEEWLGNRRIMNKYLLKYNTDTWIKNPVTHTINKFIEGWKEKAKNKIIVDDVAAEFYTVSTNVVIQVLLGNVTPPPSNHHDELLRLFSSSVKKIFETTTKLYGIPLSVCQRFNLKIWTDFKECVDLSLFLANKLVIEMLAIKNEGDGLIKKLVDENIDDVNISRIVTDFIIAAGDTTAYTSLWIFYLLSKNSQEIDNIRRKGRDYIPLVIKESMRLYPVAPFLTRIMPKNCYLGPYEIEAGTPIIASIYTSGRDEQYFTDPEQFLPSRWDRNSDSKERFKNHEPSASLPFALGARSCVGRKIAMLQLTELIWQVVENFDFKCLHSDDIKAITSQVLIQNKPYALELKLCMT
ncbi:cytochrome P450 315a1, mitochondrial [Zerene cesonia]|uniref:cytochrome P450 315a1, mitochondrial n=1 Tax=Zerene cesonia TaxID=33412 RepID=UPI0018E51850|nr:cytochrome P450 315a1, mitochondrial [Zerene cesonia]